MSSQRTTRPPNNSTLVTQTRVRAECFGDFALWQQKVSGLVAGLPGFIDQEVIPPSPPAQPDWVIVQRFTSVDAARAWIASSERGQLIEESQPWLLGSDDVHIFQDGAEAAARASAPVSAVISTRVAPGQEEAFRAWQRRIAAVQARFQGFQGYKFEPPVPGVQDDWVVILRFDSQSHLEDWLNSPERLQLVEEAAALTTETHIRTIQTGFDSWFALGDGAAVSPPAWKQNLLVILALYPIAFLFGRWVGTPLLTGRGVPFAVSFFIGNVVGTLLLSLAVPQLSRAFAWWLNPTGRDPARINWAGAALIMLLYGVLMLIFVSLH